MSFRDGSNEAQNDVIRFDAEAMLEDFALTVDAFLLECRVQLFPVFSSNSLRRFFLFQVLRRVVRKLCDIYLNVGASDVDRLDQF